MKQQALREEPTPTKDHASTFQAALQLQPLYQLNKALFKPDGSLSIQHSRNHLYLAIPCFVICSFFPS